MPVTKRSNISIIGTGGWNQPTGDLMNAFEAGDKRKSVSIGIYNGKDWDGVVRDIPYCAKYFPPLSAPITDVVIIYPYSVFQMCS